MVVQVFADARPVEHRGNAVLAQLRRRADAGQHQQVRRSYAAGGENNIVATCMPQRPMLPPPHPDGAATVERDALRLATDFEAQVGCAQSRLKKAAGCRPAPTAFLVDVEQTR